MMMPGSSRIICAGEVVWDEFPDRRVLGGAPVNVACHLAALGVDAAVVTAVGDDELGRETLARLSAFGLSTDGVQTSSLPTGRVVVTLGDDVEYDIVAPAAWDAIGLDAARQVARGDFRLVFGTLAQRSPESRATIRALAEEASFAYYDVNLRPPFTPVETVRECLPLAGIVKLNRAELAVLAEEFGLGGGPEDVASELLNRYKLEALIVTCDRDGAWLASAGGLFGTPGIEVESADPVGAGDAFFAAFIEAHISGRGWQECLDRANRRGALVASLPGAVPDDLLRQT